MENASNPLQDIAEIRALMERNTKFLSLSGLSGVGAGLVAIIGGLFTRWYLTQRQMYHEMYETLPFRVMPIQLWELVAIAFSILVAAVGVASFFSWRMARKKNIPLWNATATRLLWSILIPLAAGGIFCIELAMYGFAGMVAPATLLFYGLALLNASKFTVNEIRYLAISEIILGLAAAAMMGYGVTFWILGFGVCHIVYGILMYWRYERG